jgi:hypothetical protein
MSKMYIRVKKDGFIYEFNEILAKNAECEVIPEEVAYPERFVPAHVIERVVPPKMQVARKGRKGALDLSTDDIPEMPAYTSPELAAEASRGMP